MGYIDKKRRTIALSFGIFIIILIFFLGTIGNKIINVNDLIKEASAYEKEKIEDYLKDSLYYQDNSIGAIEDYWNSYLRDTPYNGTDPMGYIQQFINKTLIPQTNIAVSSVIIVSQDKNTILFSGHKKEEYDRVHELLEDNNELQDNTLYILNGDKDAPFGTQDRFYVTRKTLVLDEDNKIYVYVGFLEKVMYGSFINALSLDSVEEIRHETQIMLFLIIFFTAICIAFGMYLLFYMRFFQEKIFNSRICVDGDCMGQGR